jgi:hypothetical protein
VFHGFVPIPDPTRVGFWNTSFLDLAPADAGLVVAALGGAALLAACARGLRSRREVVWVFLTGTLALLAFTLFVWYGYLRHHGQIYLWFVVCCWLLRGVRPGERTNQPPVRSGLLTAVLVVQVVVAGYAYGSDLVHPFSNAEAVGRHLSRAEFSGVTLVGSIDYAVEPVTAYLDRPVYYPESERFGTFIDWGPSRRHVPPTAVIEDAVGLLRERGADVVIVLNYPPGRMRLGEIVPVDSDARLRYFARFVGAIVPDENYYLCQLYRGPAAEPDVDRPPSAADNGPRR